MLTEVDADLFTGDLEECVAIDPMGVPPAKWRGVLHATKHPCHLAAVGYSTTEKLDPAHPEYLWATRPGHMILNLIDAPSPKFFSVAMFQAALDWLEERHNVGPVLIHCNEGLSRAPSLALTYLAKRAGTLRRHSYQEAVVDYLALGAPYKPGAGIAAFLDANWQAIR